MAEKIKRNVMQKLTNREAIELAKRVGNLALELEEVRTGFDHIKKECKGKIEGLLSDIYKCHKALREGEVEKEVLCDVDYDATAGVVTYSRDGEVLEERPMTDDERQIEIAQEAPPSKSTPAEEPPRSGE